MKLFHITALVPQQYLYETMKHLEACKAYNVEVRTANLGAKANMPEMPTKMKRTFRRGGRNVPINETMYYQVAMTLPEHEPFGRQHVIKAIMQVGGVATSIGSCIAAMVRKKLIKKTGRDQYRRLPAKLEEAA